jgi:hypothetical protein
MPANIKDRLPRNLRFVAVLLFVCLFLVGMGLVVTGSGSNPLSTSPALASAGGGTGGSNGGATCDPEDWEVTDNTNKVGSDSRNYANCAPDASNAQMQAYLASSKVGAAKCVQDSSPLNQLLSEEKPVIWYLGYGALDHGTPPNPTNTVTGYPLIRNFRGYQVATSYIDAEIDNTPYSLWHQQLEYTPAEWQTLLSQAKEYVQNNNTVQNPVIAVCVDHSDLPPLPHLPPPHAPPCTGINNCGGGGPPPCVGVGCTPLPNPKTPPICPWKSGTGTNHQYINGNGGQPIPLADQQTDVLAGAWCYSRDDSANAGDPIIVPVQQDKTNFTYPQVTYPTTPTSWTASMQSDPTGDTHPGSIPFTPVNNSANSDFGNLLATFPDGSCSPDNGAPNPAAIQGAINSVAGDRQATVNISNNPTDEQSEAQGGIFLVAQSETDASFTTYSTFYQPYTRTVKFDFKVTDHYKYEFTLPPADRVKNGDGIMYTVPLSETVNPNYSEEQPLPAYGPVAGSSPTFFSCTSGTVPIPGPNKDYQVITSHANPTGFNQALTRGGISGNGSNNINQTDTNYSDAAFTNTVSPDSLPLGYSQGDRSGLFDKLAAYSGSSPSGSGGQDNYTFSRDGNYHPFKLPFWGLAYGDSVSNNSSQTTPLATAINLWSYSSPLPTEPTETGSPNCLYPNTGYADCGFLSINENTGQAMSAPGEQGAVTQTAPGPSLFDNNQQSTPSAQTAWNNPYQYNYEYSAMFPSTEPLMTSSIWASNGQEPVVLSGYQLWDPNLAINEPTSDIGWGNPGGGETEATGTVSTPYIGLVEATHANSDNASADITDNSSHTGAASPGSSEFDVVAGSTGSQEFSDSATPTDSMDCVSKNANTFISGACDFSPDTQIIGKSEAGTGYTGLTSAASKQNPLWTSINYIRGTGE